MGHTNYCSQLTKISLTTAVNYCRSNKCTTDYIYVHAAVIRTVLTFQVAESYCIYVVVLNSSSPKRWSPMYVELNTSTYTFILQDTETHSATRHIQHRPREKCACQPHTHSSGLPLRCPNPGWQQVTSMLHTATRHCRLILSASPK